ncbi:MAG: phosphomannomutase/phosphoglucomutase [Planctomycetota bacterium]|nr:MAG: phosphomannomutase/phosphoglucomutase [Planctomycetota bacterium]
MGVFKAYDVRGRCPEEVNEALAHRVGRAFADFLGNQGTVAVGHDMRATSPGLAVALERGLHEGGVDTLALGQITSPTLYYAVGSRSLAGGVMVTASHNPAGDNGFKLCREGVRPVGSNSGLAEIEAAVKAPAPAPVARSGKSTPLAMLDEYLDHVTALAGGSIGTLKVAFDCGNGVVGPSLERLLERWPSITPVKLYFEPDGTFPNHPANPIVAENLRDLQAAVKEHRCDLGVAFDGDGDRLAFVDEKGERVLADRITALLAGALLSKEPGAAVVYDLVSSDVVREEIERHGGRPIEERVGHAFIKATMRAEDALFAGENSGHYYWREHWYADSAFIALARVLALVSAKQQRFSRLIAPLQRTYQSGERNYRVSDPDAALDELANSFGPDGVSRKDGVTVRMDGWWFNARKSNTEPLLRLNVEAQDPDGLAEGLRRLESILQGY